MTEKQRSGIVVGYVVCMVFVTLALAIATEVSGATSLRDTMLGSLCISLGLSQVCLSGAWLTFGRSRFTIRLLTTVAIIVVWSWLFDRNTIERFEGTCAAFILMTGFTVSTLLLAQLLSIQLTRLSGRRTESEPDVQYSLREMFGWVLLAAIASVFIRQGIGTAEEAKEIILFVAVFSISSSALTWVIFSEEHLTMSVECFTFVFLCVMLAIDYWTLSLGDPSDQIWEIVKFNAIVCSIVGASLMIFRGLGYRLDQAGVLFLSKVD